MGQNTSKLHIESKLNKMPPQDIDLEKAILGAILLEKDSMLKAAPILKDNHFYELQHQLIYKTVSKLFPMASQLISSLLP